MRDVVRGAAQGAHQLLHPVESRVDARGEPVELVATGAKRQPSSKIACLNGGESGLHPLRPACYAAADQQPRQHTEHQRAGADPARRTQQLGL